MILATNRQCNRIAPRVPPTYQYSVLNGWAGEQEEEEVAVLDIRAGDEWSTGSRDSSDVDMLGADDPSTLDMLSMENQNGPLVPELGQTRRVSLPGDGMGGPGKYHIAPMES